MTAPREMRDRDLGIRDRICMSLLILASRPLPPIDTQFDKATEMFGELADEMIAVFQQAGLVIVEKDAPK